MPLPIQEPLSTARRRPGNNRPIVNTSVTGFLPPILDTSVPPPPNIAGGGTGGLLGDVNFVDPSSTRTPGEAAFITGQRLSEAAFGGLEVPAVIGGGAENALTNFQNQVTGVTGSAIPGQIETAGTERLIGGGDPAALREQAAGQFAPSSLVANLQSGGQEQLGTQSALEEALQQQALGGITGELTPQQLAARQVEENAINRAFRQSGRRVGAAVAGKGLSGGGQDIARILAAERGQTQALTENVIGFGQRARQEALAQGRLGGSLEASRRASALGQIGMGENIAGGRFGRGLGATGLGADIEATEFGQGINALSTGFGQEVTQANLAGDVSRQAANQQQQQNYEQRANFLLQQGLSQAQVNTVLREQGFQPGFTPQQIALGIG